MSLHVSSSPHVFTPVSSRNLMLEVLVALTPAAVAGIVFFGPRAILLICLSAATAVLTEYILQRMARRPITVGDYSAAVTGVLLALNLPPTAPWWMPVIGSAFAIAIVKQAFGGLGFNFMNPALAARALLVASWPMRMTGDAFVSPTFWGAVDAVSGATPLALIKAGQASELPRLLDLFLGSTGGCIGETSALALIAGGLYLILRRVISWRIPVTYIGTVFVMTLLMGGFDATLSLYHVLGGGLMLGAFFMATDYVTSPMTALGQVIMGVGCGVMTSLIRLLGGYPEGVSYSILLFNVATPLIERFTRPKVFGEVRRNA
ncbi:MAG: RnfABCDGE type electron transport complex subunit D [Clostridiales bacterium]|nr:RnfABCDGE type electron transport complex subunit D [Clostridiales bacterium]